MPFTFSPSNIFLWFFSPTILLVRNCLRSPSRGQLFSSIMSMCPCQMLWILRMMRRGMNPPLWSPRGESFIPNGHMSKVLCITLSQVLIYLLLFQTSEYDRSMAASCRLPEYWGCYSWDSLLNATEWEMKQLISFPISSTKPASAKEEGSTY